MSLNKKYLAEKIILAAKIREESFDTELFEKEYETNYRGEQAYYGTSLLEACKEADSDNFELLNIMLSVAWNDFLEWAEGQFKAKEQLK